MFGSNLPAGSMKGSGIYQTEIILHTPCDAEISISSVGDYSICGYTGEVDAILNDWQTGGIWECPICLTEHDFDMSDYDEEDYYEDYDR